MFYGWRKVGFILAAINKTNQLRISSQRIADKNAFISGCHRVLRQKYSCFALCYSCQRNRIKH